jgi:hypothetical protein
MKIAAEPSPFSQLDVKDHSVANNVVITGGSVLGSQVAVLVDTTSTVDGVEFRPGSAKGGAGLALENPSNGVEGLIKGLAVGDFIQFGGLAPSNNITVSSFELSKNQHDLTITYGNNQHATYHLTDMQANTTFKLTQGTASDGSHFSELTVVKTVGIADVLHDLHLV